MVAPQTYAALLGGGMASPLNPSTEEPPPSSEFEGELDLYGEEDQVALDYNDPTYGADPIAPEVLEAEDDLDVLAARIMGLFGQYEDARAEVVEGAWELSENLYDGKVDQRSFPYGALYEIREVFRQVEASRALSCVQLFGQKKRFEYKALQPESEEMTLRSTAVVTRQLKKFKLNKQLLRWLSMPAKVGTSYLYQGWASYRQIKRKLTQLHDINEDIFERLTEEVEHGGPWMEWVDHWKMYAWPYIEDIANQRAVFMRELVDGEYLRTRVREQEFDKAQVEKALHEGGTLNKYDFHRNEWHGNDTNLTGDREFQCVTCWTSTGWVYSVVNNTIVQAKRHGFNRIPFRCLTYYQNEGCHYGVSEPSILAAEQVFLRDAASMWIDSIHYKLQPMWVINRNLVPKFNNHFFRPGGVVPVDGLPDEAIKALTTPQDTFQLKDVMETIRRYMQNDTSMTDELTGLGSRHRTATGMMQLQQSASLRHKLKLIEWQDEIEQVYQDVYDMNREFLKEDVFARVPTMTGDMVPGSFGRQVFEPEVEVELNVPDSTEPPGVRQQRILPLLQLGMQRPDLVNLPYLLEEAALAFEFRNPKKVVNNPANGQRDQYQELEDWKYGVLDNVLPSDDHASHLQVMEMYSQTPSYQQRTDEEKKEFEHHASQHERYLAMQQAASAPQMQQSGGNDPQYPVSDEANARTEAMTNNAQTGAQQQGRVAGG